VRELGGCDPGALADLGHAVVQDTRDQRDPLALAEVVAAGRLDRRRHAAVVGHETH
jgi:hypothetical protein